MSNYGRGLEEGYGGGYVSPQLDEFLKEKSDVKALEKLILDAREYVTSFGVVVSPEILSEAASNVLGWTSDFRRADGEEWPVEKVLEWLDQWHRLLTGRGGEAPH